MNKKFLSAILFGALMVTSTGTFVSCKDYDDDIDNLQTQISANTTAIAELKALIGDGNYVTSVTVSGQNLVVNTKNGSTTVALPECEDNVGSICTVSEEGELLIDGKATGIKVAEQAEDAEFKPAVEIVNGEWAVLQEDGTYKSTGVAVSSIAVTGNEKEGWILTIKDAEGNAETVKLPSAASLLTNASLGDNATLSVKYYAAWSFSHKDPATDKELNVITKAADWKGPKTLPSAGDVVFANEADPIDLRIDPVNVDGTAFDYTFVDTKNGTLKKVTMKASEYKDSYEANGRAAFGNGLYSLTLDHYTIAKDDVAGYLEHFATHAGNDHAININGVYRTEYGAIIDDLAASTKELKSLTITTTSAQTVNLDATQSNKTVDGNITGVNVGQEYEVTFTDAPALYDMFFEVDAEYVSEFGVTWNNATRKFKVGKNPDASTVDSHFPMYIYTIDNTGRAKKTTVDIYLSAKLGNITMYDTYTHDVSSTYNQFDIELATMRTALGTELDKWMINVASVEAKLYAEIENGDVKGDAIQTIAASNNTDNDNLFERLFINSAKNASAAIKNAAYLRMYVDNDLAATAVATTNGTEPIKLDKTYYIKVTFSSSTGTNAGELNSMIVPVKFVAPTVAEQIEVKSGYVKDGAINAYFSKVDGANAAANKVITMNEYFKYTEQIEDATIVRENSTAITALWGTNYTTKGLVEFSGADETLDGAIVKLIDVQNLLAGAAASTELGYGKTLKFTAEKNNYAGWKYTVDGDNKFAFSMRIMSPIYEGKVASATSSTITISANDVVAGAKITDAMIKGYDYNNNSYNVVADKYVDANGSVDWVNTQIDTVWGDLDEDEYLTVEPEFTGATKDADGNVVNGVIIVKGKSISVDTEIEIPFYVKDAWGYVKKELVKVKIDVQ